MPDWAQPAPDLEEFDAASGKLKNLVLETPGPRDPCLEGLPVRSFESCRDGVLRYLARPNVKLVTGFINVIVVLLILLFAALIAWSILGLFLRIDNGWNVYYPECVAYAAANNLTLVPDFIGGLPYCTNNQFAFNLSIKAFTIIFTYVNGMKIPWRLSILHHSWCSVRYKEPLFDHGSGSWIGFDFYGRRTALSRFAFPMWKRRWISLLQNLAVLFHMIALAFHLIYNSFAAGQTFPGAIAQNVPFLLHLVCMAVGGALEIDAENKVKPQSAWYCGCLSNAILGLAATVFLLVGVGLSGMAVAIFLAYRWMLPALYTTTLLAIGVGTVLVASIGLCAACERRNEHGVRGRRCQFYLLGLFALLTLGLLVGSIAAFLLVRAWDGLLAWVADTTDLGVEGSTIEDVSAFRQLSSEGITGVISTVTTNAFDACGAVVAPASAADVTNASQAFFSFRCTNSGFEGLESAIADSCLADRPIDGAVDFAFHRCYNGTWFPSWEVLYPMPPHSLHDALNTPKGLFCACSTPFIEDYVRWLTSWGGYLLIALAIFFLVVLLVALHQLAQRCSGGSDAGLLAYRRSMDGADGVARRATIAKKPELRRCPTSGELAPWANGCQCHLCRGPGRGISVTGEL